MDLGDLIDKLTELQVKRKFFEKQADAVALEITDVESQIIHLMLDQKLEKASHGGTTVAPKEHLYANVEDWSRLYDFIHQNQYYHLLEKRVSVTGYRELVELGREVPGVVPFVKTKLSVTKTTR